MDEDTAYEWLLTAVIILKSNSDYMIYLLITCYYLLTTCYYLLTTCLLLYLLLAYYLLTTKKRRRHYRLIRMN